MKQIKKIILIIFFVVPFCVFSKKNPFAGNDNNALNIEKIETYALNDSLYLRFKITGWREVNMINIIVPSELGDLLNVKFDINSNNSFVIDTAFAFNKPIRNTKLNVTLHATGKKFVPNSVRLENEIVEKYAKKIYNAKDIVNDDEDAVNEVFESLEDKDDFLALENTFRQLFDKNLTEYLTGFLNESEYENNVSKYKDNLPHPDYSYKAECTKVQSFISYTTFKIAGYNYRVLIIFIICFVSLVSFLIPLINRENSYINYQKSLRNLFLLIPISFALIISFNKYSFLIIGENNIFEYIKMLSLVLCSAFTTFYLYRYVIPKLKLGERKLEVGNKIYTTLFSTNILAISICITSLTVLLLLLLRVFQIGENWAITF